MVDPIEITEKDLINPPPGGKALTPGHSNILGDIKTGIKQVKEIVDLAKSIGLNLKLPGKLGEMVQGSAEPSPDAPGGSNPAAQVKAFTQLLIMKYGDISVNDMVEKIRTEVGDKKLSDLLKGGK